jgi:predicted amidophosphoribosyltransferase
VDAVEIPVLAYDGQDLPDPPCCPDCGTPYELPDGECWRCAMEDQDERELEFGSGLL